MADIKLQCRLCESVQHKIIYDGPIRSGGIGSEFINGYKVLQCSSCGLAFLDKAIENLEEFYETEEYRQKFDYKTDIASMQKKFDPEQNERIARIGIETMRDKVVADFGAGPGIFIDAIHTIAQKTIVVEPSEKYRNYLSGRGHVCYAYAQEMIKAGEKIDIAFSFDTIEHLIDIRQFVRQIYESLVPGGAFYLSMPNFQDVVRLLCPASFEPFFYQVAHVNYFDAASTEKLLRTCGFEYIKMDHMHKYNMNNLMQWFKAGKPGALNTGSVFDRVFNTQYRAQIERLGIASHVFVTARKA